MSSLQGKRILVVDDDPHILTALRDVLAEAGAQVYTAVDGQEALRSFQSVYPDLVLLDDKMPDMDGWQICLRIREQSDVPIIFLPAAGLPAGIVREQYAGAIDYVPKPFHPDVLTSRARAALRQEELTRLPEKRGVYRDQRLTIDLDEQRVFVHGEAVGLTPTEHRLLVYLIQNAGRVMTFDQILNRVWGPGHEDARGPVYLYISRLRRKLERDPRQPEHLVTVRGVGYRFQPLARQSKS